MTREWNAEQEIGIRVVQVGCRTAIEGRGAAGEVEGRRRHFIVVHVQPVHVGAELHVMRLLVPAGIDHELILRIEVIEDRSGVVIDAYPVAVRAPAGDVHAGQHVVALPRLTRVGNPQLLAPAGLGPRRLLVGVLPREPENAVDDEVRGQNRRRRDRTARHVRAQRGAECERIELLADAGVEPAGIFVSRQIAEASVDVHLVAGVPRHLRIDLVEVRIVRRQRKVVVRGPRILRLRQQPENAPRHGIDAIGRDDAVREWRPAGAVGVAGQRVVNHGPRLREVAAADRRGRERQELGGRTRGLRRIRAADAALHRRLDAQEVEQLVFLDRAAGCPTEHVLVVLHLVLIGRQEKVAIAQGGRRQVFERQRLKPVRAALDLHVDRRAAGHPLVGVEAAGHDVDVLDRFHPRTVGLEPLNPLVGRAHAIDADDGVLVGCAVDRNLHRAGRIVDAAGLKVVGLRDAGREHQEALKASAVDRDVLDGLARQLRLHGRRFRL